MPSGWSWRKSGGHTVVEDLLPWNVRILVVGHTSGRLGPDHGTVQDALRSVLLTIGKVANGNGQAHPLSLVTGTGQGTEAFAQSIARDCGYELSVISAMPTPRPPVDRFVTFGYDGDETSALCAKAVAMRDEVALQFSDLVVVIWNGEQPGGLVEDFVNLLRAALLAHKCVIWVKPASVIEVRITTVERLAELDALDLPEDPTVKMITQLFVPFQGPDDPSLKAILDVQLSDGPSEEINEEFHHLPRHRSRPGLFDHVARSLILTGHRDPPKVTLPRRTRRYDPWRQRSLIVGAPWDPPPAFDKLYTKADLAANLAAGDFRSRSWIVYLLGVVAVAFAALGFLVRDIVVERACHIGELASIIAVALIWAIGSGWTTHNRWTSLRSLAEHIRYQSIAYRLAGVTEPLRQPLWQLSERKQESGSEEDASLVLKPVDSVVWLLHRLNVKAGLPSLAGEPLDVVSAARDEGFVDAYISIIREQYEYQTKKSDREKSLNDRLEIASYALFGLTLLAAGFRLTVTSRLLSLAAVTLPALAAALFAIGSKLELRRICLNSEKQAHALDRHLDLIGRKNRGAQATWKEAAELRRLLIMAADLMVAEFTTWQALVREEPLKPTA